MSQTVLIIRNAMPYDFGGGEKVPVYIAREVARQTDLRPIVCSRSEKLLKFAKENAVTTHRSWWWSRQNWSGKNALLFPVYVLWQIILLFYYLQLFARYKPVAVHLQSKDDFIAGTFAARLCGATVLWSDYADLKHIFANHKVWYKNPVGKLVYCAAHFTSTIITVSKEDTRLVAVHIPDGPVKQKLTVIYNGAFDSYQEIPKHPAFTFASASRIVTDKGIGELIDAFTAFHTAHPKSQLHILGDGPEREIFSQKAANNPAITFFGHVANPLQTLGQAHVFIIPTYHEGFSLALVEACMLALPIIATNVGGNPEIIQLEKTGLLIPAKDSSALQAAMEKLYTNTELRKSLGIAARAEYMRHFNFETIITEKIIPLYKARSA